MAKAQNPSFFGLDEMALIWGKLWSTAKEGCKLSSHVKSCEGFRVDAYLSTVLDFILVLVLLDPLPEQRGIDFGDHRLRLRHLQAGLQRPDRHAFRDVGVFDQALEG